MDEAQGGRGTATGDRRTASPVAVDLELCKACGICIGLCPDEVFDRDALGYPVLARPEDCSQCLLCELHCPDFAVEVRRREPRKRSAGRAGKAPGDADVPAVTREHLVAAAGGSDDEDAACAHDGEEG
jgi:2-oxoglutarate ferredoxin oxidoreductase subunit delta